MVCIMKNTVFIVLFDYSQGEQGCYTNLYKAALPVIVVLKYSNTNMRITIAFVGTLII